MTADGPTPLEQIREVFAAARETGLVNGCDCAPLTDEQLRDIAREVAPGQLPQSVFAHWPGLKAFARAVERAHGIGA